MVALGAAAALMGLPDDAVAAALTDSWKRGPRVARGQPGAAGPRGRRGRRGVGGLPALPALDAPRPAPVVISGNEAAGYGAIRGGVRFVAAYPITPATELLEWMAPALARVGGTLLQAEDELASINMIIGASFGGVPSLTATAGPGSRS